MIGQELGLSDAALGRAIIGLGVSACLIGQLKAFAMHFPKQRLASLTSWIMAAGGLGAIVAAAPLEYVLTTHDWRTVCMVSALLSLLMSAWRFAPLADWCIRSAMGAGRPDRFLPSGRC